MTCSNCCNKLPALPLEIVQVANGWLVRSSFSNYRERSGPEVMHEWYVFNDVDALTKWLGKRLEQTT